MCDAVEKLAANYQMTLPKAHKKIELVYRTFLQSVSGRNLFDVNFAEFFEKDEEW